MRAIHLHKLYTHTERDIQTCMLHPVFVCKRINYNVHVFMYTRNNMNKRIKLQFSCARFMGPAVCICVGILLNSKAI